MFLLELMCHLYCLLSSLTWSLNATEVAAAAVVVVATVILEDVSFGGGRGSYVVDRLLVIKSPDNVSIARGITSLKSAERSLVVLNGHSWLMLILLPQVILSMFILLQPHSGSSGSPTVVISQEYDRLRSSSSLKTIFQEFSQNNLSATYASSLGMNAYITSPQKP